MLGIIFLRINKKKINCLMLKNFLQNLIENKHFKLVLKLSKVIINLIVILITAYNKINFVLANIKTIFIKNKYIFSNNKIKSNFTSDDICDYEYEYDYDYKYDYKYD